jgi:hypothetical protein
LSKHIPQTEVLAWLHEKHPDLHATCEIDRDWVWITENLKERPEVRESIKPYGFRFCAKGHPLPCGKTGTWAHHCEHPTGNYRKGKGKKPTDNNKETEQLTPEEMAMLS